MEGLDCKKIAATIEPAEMANYNLFISAIAVRVGSNKEISIDDIIKGFAAKLRFIERDDVLKYWYNAVTRGLLKRLIYTGETFFIGENDKEMHAFINQIWKSAEQCEDKEFGKLLKVQAKALNSHIYEKN